MDRVTKYQQILIDTLSELVEYWGSPSSSGDIHFYPLFDEKNNTFAVIEAGWSQMRRAESVVVFARISEGQIFIEIDWTEDGIITDLIDAGVDPDKIVLSFNLPELVGA